MLNNAAQTAKENEAKRQQLSRLLSVLEMAPDLSAYIILQCNDEVSQDARRRAFRTFMARARKYAGSGLRYVIIQETTADGRSIAAYHVFCNMDGEKCRDTCARWKSGPYSIRYADPRERETLPPFIFDVSRIQAGRRLFNSSQNIWETSPAN